MHIIILKHVNTDVARAKIQTLCKKNRDAVTFEDKDLASRSMNAHNFAHLNEHFDFNDEEIKMHLVSVEWARKVENVSHLQNITDPSTQKLIAHCAIVADR